MPKTGSELAVSRINTAMAAFRMDPSEMVIEDATATWAALDALEKFFGAKKKALRERLFEEAMDRQEELKRRMLDVDYSTTDLVSVPKEMACEINDKGSISFEVPGATVTRQVRSKVSYDIEKLLDLLELQGIDPGHAGHYEWVVEDKMLESLIAQGLLTTEMLSTCVSVKTTHALLVKKDRAYTAALKEAVAKLG